jgi:hypothetical protein
MSVGAARLPFSARQIHPVACVVMATEATLKAARYKGCQLRTRHVHWKRTPVDAVTMATSEPRIIKARRSAAHAIDIVETPRPSGSRSLNVERSNDERSSAIVRTGSE